MKYLTLTTLFLLIAFTGVSCGHPRLLDDEAPTKKAETKQSPPQEEPKEVIKDTSKEVPEDAAIPSTLKPPPEKFWEDQKLGIRIGYPDALAVSPRSEIPDWWKEGSDSKATLTLSRLSNRDETYLIEVFPLGSKSYPLWKARVEALGSASPEKVVKFSSGLKGYLFSTTDHGLEWQPHVAIPVHSFIVVVFYGDPIERHEVASVDERRLIRDTGDIPASLISVAESIKFTER